MSKKIPVRSEPTKDKPSDDDLPIEVFELKSVDDIGHETDPIPRVVSGRHGNGLQRLGRWLWDRKWLTIPGTMIIITAILLAIPVTRYAITGWFWKESIMVVATDATNHQPVSEATVSVDGQTAKTDGKGRATFSSVPVGPHQVQVQKTYYQTTTSTIAVPWFAHGKEFDASMTATGRLVPLTVTDRVTGKPVEGVLVSAATDNKARTDADGKATIVIPADKTEVSVTISAGNYLPLSSTLKQNDANQFQIVPSGKVYFLSKQSGTLDVVKANLDGSERQVVYAGTGTEDATSTSLLASTDWKYLMLESVRTAGGSQVLTLISTADDSHSTFDVGDSSIQIAGWSGHQFIYELTRNDIQLSLPKRYALATISAETKKTTTIDESDAVPSLGPEPKDAAYEVIENPYIVDGGLIYTKRWVPTYNSIFGYPHAADDKQDQIVRVRSDGIGKNVLRSFSAAGVTYITGVVYQPNEEYFDLGVNGGHQYFAYQKGLVQTASDVEAAFHQQYPTYLISPDGDKTFWSVQRDNKNVLSIGDADGGSDTVLQSGSDFTPYGWLGEDKLLVQKNNSELYVTTPDQLKAGVAPLKLSDYYKLANGLQGYGSGYGGL